MPRELLSRLLFSIFFIQFLFSVSAQAKPSLLDEFASPVTTPAKYTLLTGSLATVIILVFEDPIVDPAQANASKLKPLGRFSIVGDYAGQLIPNAAYVLGMFIAGASGSKGGFLRAKEMFVGSAFAVGITTLLKYTVREPRPNNGKDRTSFPSGHTTSAFAFASIVGAEHGFWWGVPAYLLAGTVALSRMNDNKHYLHDVVGGATIGMAYGLGVYYANHRGASSYSFTPLFDDGKFGLVASKYF